MVKIVKFKKFINEANQEEYGNLLDDVASLLDTVGDQLVYVKKAGNAYTCIQLSGENYVEVKVQGSKQDIIKTQKIYKDGEVTNYDLAITRLKELKSAIENEQFVTQSEGE